MLILFSCSVEKYKYVQFNIAFSKTILYFHILYLYLILNINV